MPESLLTKDNPYLHSLLYEAAAIYPLSNQTGLPRTSSWNWNTSSESDTIPKPQEVRGVMHETAYLKPFHAAEVIDSRFSHARISSLTSVCDDDVLMRNLLSGWLHYKYHFTAAFQKELFLEDMAAHREDFCSSLLVNIVLGYSCVQYLKASHSSLI